MRWSERVAVGRLDDASFVFSMTRLFVYEEAMINHRVSVQSLSEQAGRHDEGQRGFRVFFEGNGRDDY
jgi:hypothetical protein